VVVSNHLPTKGSGNQYQFLDETAFKTTETFYRYRITPFDSSGKVVGAQYYTNVIGGGVSSVRRTGEASRQCSGNHSHFLPWVHATLGDTQVSLFFCAQTISWFFESHSSRITVTPPATPAPSDRT